MSIYIIAELGINHNGSMAQVRALMEAAKGAGADAVKFQKRTVEVVYTPEELARPRESPFGSTNGDLKRGLELSMAQYGEIDRWAKELGLDWSASCWDVASVHCVASVKPSWLKVPSALLTNQEVLTAYRQTGIPVLMSTGMSTEAEVDAAVQTLHDVKLVLLHCHAAYPSPIDELNLSAILTIQQRYGLPVGYSSHTTSPWPCLMAAVLGATVLEAHLTLDRTAFGSDQAASLEPQAFGKLVTEVRTWEKARGDGIKRLMPSEVPIKEKLRR